MKCALSIKANECPFCDKDKMECKNENKCSFQENEDNIIKTQDGYVRKERWYDKYYRKKK